MSVFEHDPDGPSAPVAHAIWFEDADRAEGFAERVERIQDHIAAGRYEDRAVADLAVLVTVLAGQALAVGR